MRLHCDFHGTLTSTFLYMIEFHSKIHSAFTNFFLFSFS